MKFLVKRLVLAQLLLLCLFCAVACSGLGSMMQNPTHSVCSDTNKDTVCDICGKYVPPVTCARHTDNNNDGKCDRCDASVNKKMTDISFENASFVYDGTEKTIKVEGAPQGASVSYNVLNSQTDVGEYNITAAVNCQGYESCEITATLSILPKAITINFAKNQGPFSPNGRIPELEYTLDGVLDGDEVEVEFNFKNCDFKKEGSFEVTASSKNPNYKFRAKEAKTEVSFVYAFYTVCFETGVENKTISPEEVKDGSTVDEPGSFYNRGYELVGWYYGENAWNFDDPVTENMTLNAVWKPSEYSINYNLGGGKNSDSNPSFYTVESEFAIQPPQKDGYVFHGWYLDSDFSEKAQTDIKKGSAGAITLYANWSCDKTISVIERIEATPLRDGYVKTNCTVCYSKEKTEVFYATNSIKLLAIGNSFSIDALEYFYQILADAGVENIVIANLYRSGCSIDMHLDYALNDKAEYTLYLSDSEQGKMVAQSDLVTLEYGLSLDDWDIITMQQASKHSYQSSKYANVDELIDYVREYQPDSKLYWHMTWAYDTDYLNETESSFADSTAMYNGIIDAVSENILTSDKFSVVIPVGTAIQNLRTSYLGDDQTRDGCHLSRGIGRYTAALTWFAHICGVGVESVQWTPDSYFEVSENLDVIKEAVNNSYLNCFEITESKTEK